MLRRFGQRRRGPSGFTLIEILIALVVLFIGIVGIIALFPIGIRSTKESVEDTNAALIAESVHHQLVQALRTGVPAGGRITVSFFHDGSTLSTQAAGPYVFNLPARPVPPTAGNLVTEYHHPGGQAMVPEGNATGAVADPNVYTAPAVARPNPPAYSNEVFRCADTVGNLRDSVQDIRGNVPDQPANLIVQGGVSATRPATDMSLDYGQYFYDFWVQPVYVQRGGNWESLPLYQFRIRVFRNYEAAAPGMAGGNNSAIPNAPVPPNQFLRSDPREGGPIHEFRVLIASNS